MSYLSFQYIKIHLQIDNPYLFKQAFKKELVKIGLFSLLLGLTYYYSNIEKNVIWKRYYHNFYGSLKVVEQKHQTKTLRLLQNGSTLHGLEILDESPPHSPTAYYSPKNGFDFLFRTLHADFPSLHVGIVGMGIGTLSAYLNIHDHLRFYEINPLVPYIAQKHFTYIQEALDRGVHISTILGDAHLSLSEENTQQSLPRLNLLILDAFNSDSIPAHLLTLEALHIYQQRLRHNGLVVIHTSNRHINLNPVVARLAQEHGGKAFQLLPNSDLRLSERFLLTAKSDWIVITNNPIWMQRFAHYPYIQPLSTSYLPRWTDHFHSLHCLWKLFPC